jgi:hypothetical protein
MRQPSRPAQIVAVTVAALALFVPVPATAQYLDPGSASIIVQAVVAGVVAVGAGVRLYWTKLSGLFSRRRPNDTEHGEL